MNGKKQCPSCGRQLEETYQFCPFDSTPLSRRCPNCGRELDSAYQFCPFDSAPLSPGAVRPAPTPVGAATEAAPVGGPGSVERRPLQAEPAPALDASAFTFAEEAKKATWKATVYRPATILFAIGAVIVAGVVYYLTYEGGGPDLPPPTVSYTVLPNEGKTKGVPVAIKINQLAVFMIDDPMESGASRAKQLVTTLDQAIRDMAAHPGEKLAVETVGDRPVILKANEADTQRQTLVTVSDGDTTLAGEPNGTRLATIWAERFTDAIKVFVFGEAPTFSTGTAFGDALRAMYKGGVGSHGKVTKRFLDAAFQRLTPEQRKAMETPPGVK